MKTSNYLQVNTEGLVCLQLLFRLYVCVDDGADADNGFVVNSQLRFTARTFCDELEDIKVEITLDDVLFLCKSEMLIRVKLENDDDKDLENSFLVMKQFESFGLSPVMTISNETFSKTLEFDSAVNLTLVGWTKVLHRQTITGSTFVPPISLLAYKVVIEFPNHLYRTEAILIDIYAQPFLKWTLCCPIEINYLRKFVVYLHSLEPACEGSKLFSLMVVHSSFQGIVLALSHNDKVEYYNLASRNNKQICGTALKDCADLYLLDAIMTQHHLIFATTEGILVSNDLLDIRSLEPEMMSFELIFRLPKISERFSGINGEKIVDLKSVGECDFHSMSHVHIKETVMFTILNRRSIYISVRPYRKWELISLREERGESLITVTLDEHRQQFIILEKNVMNVSQVAVMLYPTLVRLYSFVFPMSFTPSTVIVHPTSRDILIIGNEVWISEDSGKMFRKLHSLDDDAINPLAYYMDPSGEFVFVSNKGKLLYGKIGLLRMVSSELPKPSFENLILYNITRIFINSSNIVLEEFQKFKSDFALQRSEITISQILSEQESLAPAFFCIQHITAKQAVLYQYISDDNSSDVLGERHVRKILRHKLGGEAILKEIVPNPSPKFKNGVILNWIKEFSHESENKFEIDVEQYSSDTLLVTGSWTEKDEGKTIVFSGLPSILLVKLISPSEMEGVSLVNMNASVWADGEKDWYLYSFVKDDQSLLELAEDDCRFVMDVFKNSEDVSDLHSFIVDLKEELQLDVEVNTLDEDYAAITDVEICSVLKNPNAFRITGKRKRKATKMIFSITIAAVGRSDVVSSLMINIPDVSMKCNPSKHFTIFSCCPKSKVFKLSYTLIPNITTINYKDLPLNYRPPSQFGVAVPTSRNIYNADPTVPRWQDKTLMSQATGQFKQCLNKTSRGHCDCTELMEESQLVLYSDCKRKVKEIRHMTYVLINFTHLKQQNRLDWASYVSLLELNQRKDYSVLLPDEMEVIPDSQNITEFSNDARLFLKGSGLYHFRITLHSNSKCNLTDEFQVFALPVTLPYPFYYMWNCLVVVITGVVLLATYIWYSIAHPSTNRLQRQQKLKSSSGQSTTLFSKEL